MVALFFVFFFFWILCIVYEIRKYFFSKNNFKIWYYNTVRTNFGFDSKTGMDSSLISPNNKFIERGRKNKPEFRKDVTIVDGLEEYLNE